MNAKSFVAIGLVILGLAAATTAAGVEQGIQTGSLSLGPVEFASGALQDLIATEEGLVLVGDATSGHFTSAVIDAPLPFNALVPRWSAETPDRADLTVHIRTSKHGDRWSDWIRLLPNDDWMVPEDESMLGQMIAVPGEDVTHNRLQFFVTFGRYAGDPSPILQALDVTFFDSTQGPTAAELTAQQEALDAESTADISGYPKPSVVGRTTWCTDSACNYGDGLQYERVTHLIVHHTVTGNSSTNWAAIVRAIWRFHTFPDSPSCSGCRGWGDIGYNYLVDMNGVLYEGHLGGDDVIGTHAGGANAGSMALAFIGTFTSSTYNPPGIAPPAPMRNSAVELFAWKADQRDIDVHGSGYLPNVNKPLPNLMGHRDVYGTTQCPGDQAYALLPWLRDQVANKVTVSTIYIDELSAAFSKNDVAGWLVAPDNCGDNGHAYYAWSTQESRPTYNHGVWRPYVPKSGIYELQAFIPYCITGAPETDGASYTVHHARGDSTVILSQEDHVRTWMSLGKFEFAAGNSAFIELNNHTQTDSGLGVWFDALRLQPADPCSMPSIPSLSPASGTWFKQRNITFNWSIGNGQAVATTKLEVATDAGFSNIIKSREFTDQKSSEAITFDRDYTRLYWRVKLINGCHQVVTSTVKWLGIDTIPPTSAVRAVYQLDDEGIWPVWGGQDAGSGIKSYNVDVRPYGDPNNPNPSWSDWLTNDPRNSAFYGASPGDYFSFRSQAVDAAGNVEPLHSGADITSVDAIRLYRAIMFPLILKQ